MTDDVIASQNSLPQLNTSRPKQRHPQSKAELLGIVTVFDRFRRGSKRPGVTNGAVRECFCSAERHSVDESGT